jgi:hypothetical protein
MRGESEREREGGVKRERRGVCKGRQTRQVREGRKDER